MGLYLGSGEKLKFITDNGSTNVVKYLPHIKHVNTDTGGDTGGNLTGKYIWNIYTNSNKTLQIGKTSSDDYNKYPIIGGYTDGFYYVMQNALFDVFEVDTITHTNYEEVKGTSGSVALTGTIKKMAATSYTSNGTTFTLTNPTSTAVSSLNNTHYIVNIGSSNNTSTSGNKLYKINTKTNLENEIKWSIESESFVISAVSLRYYTSYSASSSSFTVSGQKSTNAGSIAVGTIMYSHNTEFNGTAMGSFHPLYKGTVLSKKNTYEVSDDGNYIYEVTIKLEIGLISKGQTEITYTPYTISTSTSTSTEKGSLVETISASAESYPKDGIQGDYWYVLRNSDIE